MKTRQSAAARYCAKNRPLEVGSLKAASAAVLFSYLEHLLDFLPWQVDIELVEELQDLADAEAAVTVLIGFGEGLFQPLEDTSG